MGGPPVIVPVTLFPSVFRFKEMSWIFPPGSAMCPLQVPVTSAARAGRAKNNRAIAPSSAAEKRLLMSQLSCALASRVSVPDTKTRKVAAAARSASHRAPPCDNTLYHDLFCTTIYSLDLRRPAKVPSPPAGWENDRVPPGDSIPDGAFLRPRNSHVD